MDPLAEYLARRAPRSKLGKEFRKLQMEKLLCTIAIERDRNVGSVEIAEMLGVTPRTVRNYLREGKETLFGPQQIELHNIDETGKTVSVDLLPLDECAQKLGISTRELRRRIWMERRDRIAKLRAEYKQ